MDKKKTIGWKEWVSLPAIGISAIKAKIDTGARTSALHTYQLKRLSKNGKDIVRFNIHPLQKNTDNLIVCESEILDMRTVKDSGGHKEERIFIQTPITIHDKTWDIEISLTSRENMLFRMLLGRTALVSGGMIVSPELKYTAGRQLETTYNNSLDKAQ
ncbi:MAG: hypothetical protein ACI85N_000077 [Gammaproteobacteria bacterium]|jgi:hypothetical protein